MHRHALKYLRIICAVLICSCVTKGWDWDAKPYAADYEAGYIINAEGHTVNVDIPEFNDYTAFHIDNIIELMENIERLNISDKKKDKILNVIESCLPYNIK